MKQAVELTFQLLAEDCMLVSWPQVIEPQTIRQITALGREMSCAESVMECVPAYASLAIYFDTSMATPDTIEHQVRDRLTVTSEEDIAVKAWQIPVCYDPTMGLDQQRFAEEKSIAHDELVHLHTKSEYTVLMRGFLPGFLYMGGLDERLHLPRHARPRARVHPGSVAIADGQTGIYPLESPGGWNVIGRTPTVMLDFSSRETVAIAPGDTVRFVPIRLDEYLHLAKAQHGPYSI